MNVVMIGDSHADHITPPMWTAVNSLGHNLRVETRGGCSFFATLENPDAEANQRCTAWAEEILADVSSNESIDAVIIAEIDARTVAYDEAYPKALEAIRNLEESGKQVIVVRGAPYIGTLKADGAQYTGPECAQAFPGVDDACAWEDGTIISWLATAGHDAGVPVVDLHDIICPEGTCHLLFGGLIAYIDTNHFTVSFSESLSGWFRQQLEPHLLAS